MREPLRAGVAKWETQGPSIGLRPMDGADFDQIAKNGRAGVEMIEKYHASHLKNRLDAAAIKVRKPKRRKQAANSAKEAA